MEALDPSGRFKLENGFAQPKQVGPAQRFALAFLALSATLAIYLALFPPALKLSLQMSSSVNSTAVVFYDTGAGFNEADASRVNLSANLPGQFQTLVLPLPTTKKIFHIRFDQTIAESTIVIKNVTISSDAGYRLKIPPADLKPFFQIRQRIESGAEVTFVSDLNATDPGISISLHEPISQVRAIHRWWFRWMATSCTILAICLVFAYTRRHSLQKLYERSAQPVIRADLLLDMVARRLTLPNFIRFDSAALWFLFICFASFLLASLSDLNGSSSAIYHDNYQMGAPEKTWIGSPRNIRSDEWSYATPDILHQSLRLDRFNAKDSARGGHFVALLDSVPVWHLSTLFRPQFWAFFILPVDYGFAFFWQCKALILVAGIFIWLLLLTRSTYWSICGSLWFLFSPSMQWSYSWSSSLPEMIGLICLLMVSVCFMTVARTTVSLFLAGLCTACCAINFALCAYVPHLLPLCWVAAAFIGTWCFAERKSIFVRSYARYRMIALVTTLLLIGVVAFIVFADVRQAIVGISNTTYPGKRVIAGANFGVGVFTSHFLQWTESETMFPPRLFNICEGSGFLWLAPVTLFCVERLVLSKIQRVALVAFWLCSAFMLAWLLFPIPAEIAKVLLLDKTGGARCVPALGLLNMAIVAVCMSSSRSQPLELNGQLRTICTGAGLGIVFYAVLQLTNESLSSFFSLEAVGLASAFAALLSLLILKNRGRALGLLLVLTNGIAFGAVNPVQRGLGVFTHSDLYKLVHKNTELLKGKWLVYSDSLSASSFVEATGCDTYTGMRFLPDIDHFALFAARGMDVDVFNNDTYLLARPISASEKSHFEGPAVFATIWYVNPTDSLLKSVGVRYLAFDREPSALLKSKLKPILNGPVDTFWLYEIPSQR